MASCRITVVTLPHGRGPTGAPSGSPGKGLDHTAFSNRPRSSSTPPGRPGVCPKIPPVPAAGAPWAAPGPSCSRPSAPGCAARPWRNFPPCASSMRPSCWHAGHPPARSRPRWATARARISARNSAQPQATHRRPTGASSRDCPLSGKTGNKKIKQNLKPLLQNHRRKSKIVTKGRQSARPQATKA